jgi:hypothetical protein
MSIDLYCPIKPKKIRKIQISKEKRIPFPRFEPETSGLAVGRQNHYTIGHHWVAYSA